jgi:signal transduction histidine kinase
MISSSVYLLFTLKTALYSEKSELGKMRENMATLQGIDTTYTSEVGVATTYLAAGHPSDLAEFLRRNSTFDHLVISLKAQEDRPEIQSIIDSVSVADAAFVSAVSRAVPGSASGVLARDQVHVKLSRLQELYRFSFNRSLKIFEQRTTNALDGAGFVLVLSFLIVVSIAIMITHNLTKPIHALKSSAEKVGEGIYQNVSVTTRDEIGDLTGTFNAMSEKLKRLDEMRMEMMSEISHEMRTPLQVIKAATYSIAHQRDGAQLTEKQSQAIGMIHQATNRISSFVNSFLDIAKLEAGLMKFNLEPTDVAIIVEPIIAEMQLIGQTRQIAVSAEFSAVPELQLDREKMSQVFTNLLSNALKYTPDNGKICIHVSASQDDAGQSWVRVDVQDSGVGIPPDDLKKLFNKFYQAKNKPLVKEKGSGLGLALVKHVTEAHGGKVSVSSQLGKGSTFSVMLPMRFVPQD